MATDPLYNEIDASNLESVRKNVVFQNFFVGTPFQQKLRKAGVLDPFLGGNGMMEGFIYGRLQGAAVAPGQTVTVTRQQTNTAFKMFPKAYAAWAPIDDWELDDGSGTGGVINAGPSRIINQYTVLMEGLTDQINTMLEMDSFRHGQASATNIAQNRILNSNGLSEALNNGVDPSWDGNIFTTYGGQTRNGAIGSALNSTPLWCGTSSGATGQIDFNVLMQAISQCEVTGGQPDLGITNVLGFVAIANALNTQRRDVSNTKHDISYEGLNFNGVDFYKDPLAPSAQAVNFIPLATSAGGGNTTLVDGGGLSTVTGTFTSPASPSSASKLPANQTCTVGEVLFILESSSFKIRPTDKKGWNFGIRRSPMPNNVSMDALFMRLGTNLYNTMPRHSQQVYGFSS